MKQFRFQTDLQCAGCVSKVEPRLNRMPGVERWEVALADPDRVLSVWGHEIDPGAIASLFEACGFEAIQKPDEVDDPFAG